MRKNSQVFGYYISSFMVMFWNEGKLGTDVDEHILVRQEISSSELNRIIAKLRLGRRLYPER